MRRAPERVTGLQVLQVQRGCALAAVWLAHEAVQKAALRLHHLRGGCATCLRTPSACGCAFTARRGMAIKMFVCKIHNATLARRPTAVHFVKCPYPQGCRPRQRHD